MTWWCTVCATPLYSSRRKMITRTSVTFARPHCPILSRCVTTSVALTLRSRPFGVTSAERVSSGPCRWRGTRSANTATDLSCRFITQMIRCLRCLRDDCMFLQCVCVCVLQTPILSWDENKTVSSNLLKLVCHFKLKCAKLFCHGAYHICYSLEIL